MQLNIQKIELPASLGLFSIVFFLFFYVQSIQDDLNPKKNLLFHY